MSIIDSNKPIGLSIEKKPSITEDLHLKPVSKLSEGNAGRTLKPTSTTQSKKPLNNIKEESSIASSEVTPIPVPKPAAATSANISSKQADNEAKPETVDQPRKTFAEITQDLKGQLGKTAEEVEKSNVEFERLIGNLEKKIEALRILLDSSK